jgi:hypothetical protein
MKNVKNAIKVSEIKLLKSLSFLYRANNEMPLEKLLGGGNMKLPNTTAIFNMETATSCSSKKLGICKASIQGANCYALKAEKLYINVLPFRMRQAKLWKSITAEDFAFQFLMSNATKAKPFKMLRFNESGDFTNQASVDKAEKIARILKRSGIKTYCYTSRSDLSFKNVRDLIITGSNFKKDGIKNIFKIVKDVKKDRPSGYGVCPMNCRICSRCSNSNTKTVVKSH